MGALTPFAYASVAQFRLTSVLAKALTNVSDDVIQQALYDKARTISGYLKSQFKLPLIDWGDDIRQLNIDLATGEVMRIRGYNPAGQDAVSFGQRAEECKELLHDISRRIYVPDVTDSATPPDVAPSPQASSMLSPFDAWAPNCGTRRW